MPGLPVEAQAGDVVEVVRGKQYVLCRFHIRVFRQRYGKRNEWVGTKNVFYNYRPRLVIPREIRNLIFGSVTSYKGVPSELGIGRSFIKEIFFQ